MSPRIHTATHLVLFLFAACSDTPEGPTRDDVTALRGQTTSLVGPIAGVVISVGAESTTSDAEGRYQLRLPAGAHVVRYEKTGFVTTFERVEVVSESPTQLDTALLELAPGMPLDAAAGGSVAAARGASLTAPASAFVDRAGEVVTGMVTVHLTPIDPSGDELRAAPGDFSAEMDGSRVMLESFGMMDITVRRENETLAVAPGQEIEIRIPVAAGATEPEAMQAVWSFDEARGIWVDEGMAMFDAASGTYVARTSHMSIWNIDKRYTATCVCGTINERGAGPLPGARVQSEGLDYFGSSDANSDADGRFCLAVRKNSRVSIAGYHASGGGAAIEIMSGEADTDVPPTRGDARCVDIGVIEVERDTFRYPDGTVASCGAVESPFSNPCGSELWAVFECYSAMGECTIESGTDGSSTISYANGARFEVMVSGMMFSGDLHGPSGELCATMSTTVSSDPMADFVITYVTPASREFTMTIPGGETGDYVIGCPDGTSFVMSPEERQAVNACRTDSAGSDDSMCRVVGGPAGGCVDDTSCTDMPGTVCCPIAASASICLDAATCEMATACGMTCPAMQFCDPEAMMCRSYCDLVMCPSGQTCDPATATCS
jgi:hypothetical protein